MMDTKPNPIYNRIDQIWSDHRELVAYLQSSNQLQLQFRAEEAFSKTLIVAAASYFEVQLTHIIVDLFREATHGAEPLAQFVKNQAIGRRFAQLFDWGDGTRPGRNANGFYKSFGPEFADYMKQKVESDQTFDASVKAFLEIGDLRNQMVHGNFVDFQLNKTVDEVYQLYQTATDFVNGFSDSVREFITSNEREC